MNSLYDSRIAMIRHLGDVLGRRSHTLPALSAITAARSRTSIANEGSLIGGENVGGEGAEAATPADGDDDDGGDGDSDPDRKKKRPRKVKRTNLSAQVVSEKTKRRDGAVEGKTLMTNKLIAVTPAKPHALPSEGYVRLTQIIGDPNAEPPIPAVIPISKSSWWAGCKSGRYPAPVKLGPRTTAWKVSDIRALIAAA